MGWEAHCFGVAKWKFTTVSFTGQGWTERTVRWKRLFRIQLKDRLTVTVTRVLSGAYTGIFEKQYNPDKPAPFPDTWICVNERKTKLPKFSTKFIILSNECMSQFPQNLLSTAFFVPVHTHPHSLENSHLSTPAAGEQFFPGPSCG